MKVVAKDANTLKVFLNTTRNSQILNTKRKKKSVLKFPHGRLNRVAWPGSQTRPPRRPQSPAETPRYSQARRKFLFRKKGAFVLALIAAA